MKKTRRTKGGKRANLKTKKVIRKKKAAFAKKAKKHAKQLLSLGINPSRNVARKKGRMAVPNLCPFKEDLIKMALRKRKELREELEQKKQEKSERKVDLRKAVENCKKERKLGMMCPKSLGKTAWAHNGEERELQIPKSKWEHKHWYFKELNKVIADSDVIIEVLDARDPDGCRSREIEKRVIRQESTTFMGNKRLILMLNKIDLVPAEILAKWMKILKREYPVVAFKSSTQSQSRKLHSNMKFNKVTSDKGRATTNRCVGAKMVVELLKKYSLSCDKTTPITVGFIGYPNTGKSSVINSLKRSQSVGTSPVAGFTKTLQTVKLDSKIKLIDSPGVILKDNEVETRLVLRNALKLQDVDPIEAVAHILTVANHRSLAKIYGIRMPRGYDHWGSFEEFLLDLARKLNRMKHGGAHDLELAAKMMINDWNRGKIPFYVNPPEIDESDTSTRFVEGGFSEEFDIAKFMEVNHAAAIQRVESVRKFRGKEFMQIDSDKFMIGREVVDEVDDVMDQFEDVDLLDESESSEVDLIDDEVMQTHAFQNA